MDTTKYPIGIQTFETLRKTGCVYVDKTEYVYSLATGGSRTFFLSRPRRFGKSLLLSTLDAYFSGRKDLFEGLAIYGLEQEWKAYPVLRFDFSRTLGKTAESLTDFISLQLREYERKYNITDTSVISETGLRFGMLIRRIHEVTGAEVVILIDEYDKGIHEVLDNEEQIRANQDVLRPFFSQIKAMGEHIRFCFITGVARFRNYTIFSGFNNPDDLSMREQYAAICGITRQELLDNFHDGIQALAEKLGCTYDQAVEQLRLKYDGYRFTDADVLVFNPFSILNCLAGLKLANYWIKSGTPKVFVDYLSRSHFDLLELEDLWVTQESMEGTYSTEDPIPLLFQAGYLTISRVRGTLYRLCIPNGEVRSALVDDLMPRYMGVHRNKFAVMAQDIWDSIDSGDVDGLMTHLQQLVASIPYQEMDLPQLEKTYHLVIYELFLIMGVDARCEVAMSGGRIDLLVQNSRYVFVIEFKLGGTAEQALAQIDDRGYALAWSADGRTVLKVGAVFSPETRTLSQWTVTH